jgi:Alginate lyase
MKKLNLILVFGVLLQLTGCSSLVKIEETDVIKKRNEAISSVVGSGSLTELKTLESFKPNGSGQGYINYEYRLKHPAPARMCEHNDKPRFTEVLPNDAHSYEYRGIPTVTLGGNSNVDILNVPNPAEYLILEFNTRMMEIFYYNDLGDIARKENALLKLKSLLLTVKNKNYFMGIKPDNNAQGYSDQLFNLRELLTIMIQSFAIARDTKILTFDETTQLHNWIEKRVATTIMGVTDGAWEGPLPPGIHMELQKGLMLTTWGSVANDELYYKAGIKSFMAGLSQARKDGSHAEEVTLRISNSNPNLDFSVRGLANQNQVVGYMSIIAEIAKFNGQDLYSVKNSNGLTLTDMQNFIAYALRNDIETPYIISKRADRLFATSISSPARSIAWYVPVYYKTNNNIFGNYFSTDTQYVAVGFGGSLNCFIR